MRRGMSLTERINAMKLIEVYQVPRRVDEEGRLWYRCLHDMHFATAKVGWAVGSTQILHTRDGGRIWVNQFKENKGCYFLNPHRVFAVTPKVCWITAISTGRDIRCCYTKDGGRTWRGKKFETEIHPNDIFFIDSKRGWLVSDNGPFPANEGRVHLTEDGGESWKALEVRMDGRLHRIRFYDFQKGWSIEHYGNRDDTRTYSRLHTSDDGGRSWRKIARFDRPIFDHHALDENHLFVVGEIGYIAKTTDGGRNWKRIESKTRANFNAVRFYDDRIGIALGDFDTLLLSTDGGQTWEKIRTTTNSDNFVNAHFETNTRGILASNNALYSFELDL